jgi:hypothetical protein
MFKKCTPLWREAHVEVKMQKAHHCRSTFGSGAVQKLRPIVGRSTFQNKRAKDFSLGTVLELAMFKVHVAVARSPC